MCPSESLVGRWCQQGKAARVLSPGGKQCADDEDDDEDEDVCVCLYVCGDAVGWRLGRGVGLDSVSACESRKALVPETASCHRLSAPLLRKGRGGHIPT